MFAALKTLNPNFQPLSVITDFETGARNAIKNAFSETKLAGSLPPWAVSLEKNSDLPRAFQQV